MNEDEDKIDTSNIDVEALYKAHSKVCVENSALRRRLADFEDFLRGAAKQFNAMAGKP